ncbi:MAG TPA: ribonuclease III [Candidatus Binatia bacterium]|jgi:ribonuclease-3|nr:ribonuclease III [Candidatus Binatia bacterium]
MEDLLALEERLGVEFGDYSLLRRALTHRSYLNENPDADLRDNERLEFLGDAVLDFVVGAYLYQRFPDMDEGGLTALRAALVRTKTLAEFARHLDVGGCLWLGYGEEESGGRDRTPTLCAAFEAIVGAIYLDQGLDAVQPLVERLAGPALERIMDKSLYKDAKSEFQMWAQAAFNVTPHYEVVSEKGPDHDKTFTVQALVGNDVWGVGTGHSKQAAAQAAANVALARATTPKAREPDAG